MSFISEGTLKCDTLLQKFTNKTASSMAQIALMVHTREANDALDAIKSIIRRSELNRCHECRLTFSLLLSTKVDCRGSVRLSTKVDNKGQSAAMSRMCRQ